MEYNKARNNTIMAGICFLFCIAMILFIIPGQISVSTILGTSEQTVDSRFFPYVLCVIIAVMSSIECVSSALKMRRLHKEKQTADNSTGKGSLIKVFAVFGLMVLYALVFQYAGFIPATAVVPPLTLLILGKGKWQHFLAYYLVAAITYVVFAYILQISI